MTVLAAVAVAYLFMGRVFVFITRYGASRTRVGQVIVALTWPLMVLVLLTI